MALASFPVSAAASGTLGDDGAVCRTRAARRRFEVRGPWWTTAWILHAHARAGRRRLPRILDQFLGRCQSASDATCHRCEPSSSRMGCWGRSRCYDRCGRATDLAWRANRLPSASVRVEDRLIHCDRRLHGLDLCAGRVVRILGGREAAELQQTSHQQKPRLGRSQIGRRDLKLVRV